MASLSNKSINAVADRLRKGDELPTDRQVIQQFRERLCRGLGDTFESIAATLDGVPCVLSCRVKRIDTITRKLLRETSMDLTRMDDIVGFRIVTGSVRDQVNVVKLLQSTMREPRVRDYTSEARPTGYRAVHLSFARDIPIEGTNEMRSYRTEIQIRTAFQNLWANTSESFGEQVKEGGGSESEIQYLAELSMSIANNEHRMPDRQQLSDLATAVSLSYIIVVFQKEERKIIKTDSFGSDLQKATEHLLYLEDLYRADLGHEAVLLGVPLGERDARITHTRYFSLQGIPEIPPELAPDFARPL